MGFVFRKGLEKIPAFNGIMQAMEDELLERAFPESHGCLLPI